MRCKNEFELEFLRFNIPGEEVESKSAEVFIQSV